MKLKVVATLLFCLFVMLPGSGGSESSAQNTIEGITIQNFPVIDGSDSTTPLRTILMCKLLGFGYHWRGSWLLQNPDGFRQVEADYSCTDEEENHLELYCLQENNTHQSFINLLEGKVELVIAARGSSRDEKKYADSAGVDLIEKPIAKDALTFMVHEVNPVTGLTTEQIRKIYTEEITNWKEVGGLDTVITPFIRNRNSGSQEKFETLVMSGLELPDFPEWRIGRVMNTPYLQIENSRTGIAFTPYYYFSVIAKAKRTKELAVDGVAMTKENIANGTYPYITDVVAAVRADVDRSSMAYKLFEFLTTQDGQSIVEESGYVPLTDYHTDVNSVKTVCGGITFSDGWLTVEAGNPVRVEVIDMAGRTVFSSSMPSRAVRLPRLAAGVYAVKVTIAGGGVLSAKVMSE